MKRISMNRTTACAGGSRSARGLRMAKVSLMALLLLGAWQVASLRACDVPVFRYALERWESLPYRLIVLHREPLKENEQAMVDSLTKAAQNEEQPANLIVQTVDLGQEKPEWPQALYKHLESPALPCAVLLQADLAAMYMGPNQGPPGGTIVWSGPLEKDLGTRLLDSPARRDIIRRLLKGDSAVWVLLESGDKAKDDAAVEKMSKNLKELGESLKLPEDPTAEGADAANAGPDDGTNIDVSGGVPLKVAFSVLRLSRTDPAEAMFVKMLLATQSEPRPAASETESPSTDNAEAKADAEKAAAEKKTDGDKKAKAKKKKKKGGAEEQAAAADKSASAKPDAEAKPAKPQAKQPEVIEPAVFVIFGRGRVLGSLTGEEIEEDSIVGGCEFLCGDCSCVIKDNRPGTDLLMTVNWDQMLAGELLVDKALPPLTGVLPAGPVSPAAETPSAAEKPAVETPAVEKPAVTEVAVAMADAAPTNEAAPAAAEVTAVTSEAAPVAAVVPDVTAAPADDHTVVRNVVIVLAVVLGAVVFGTVILLRRGGE